LIAYRSSRQKQGGNDGTSAPSTIHDAKLNAFFGRMLGDLGALTNAVLVHVGDQLGFYKTLTRSGPMDSSALAKQTGTAERPVRAWLRVFRPAYNHSLVKEWLPAGRYCGEAGTWLHGRRCRVWAWRFHHSDGASLPQFEVLRLRLSSGIDRSRTDIGSRSRRRWAHIFRDRRGKDFPALGFDLICFFDCLHDMGDPVGAAHHVGKALAADSTWMIVEPFAQDRLEDNLNPVGALCYAASTVVCTPASLAQEVGLALGAQGGEARLKKVVMDGGFRRFPRAAETSIWC
jgi:hypothetical protein